MTPRALQARAWAKSSLKSATAPKKLGFCTSTAAQVASTAALRPSMSLRPSLWGTVTRLTSRLEE